MDKETFIDPLTTLHYRSKVYYYITANESDGKRAIGTDKHFSVREHVSFFFLRREKKKETINATG